MKVAQFKSMEHGYISVLTAEDAKYRPTCVQVSDFVEVEFPPLISSEVVEQQLAVLQKAEAELRTRFEQKLVEINAERQKLRAIAHEGASL